jgi:hypothetical protein
MKTIETQVCTHCGIEKKLEDYHKGRGTKNGRLKRCRKCWSIRKQELYKQQYAAGKFGYCEDCNAPLARSPKGRKQPHCKDCRFGENAYNWKGGHITEAGYVMIRRKDGSPTFKHRVVMEDYIGRRLTKDETVHHKNGVRNDNRIENLELWVGAHPKGLKIKDAVKWANEILERYT